MLELDAGVLGGEPPVHAGPLGIAGLLPGADLGLERCPVRDAPVQALFAQDRQLDLSEPKLLHLL